MGLSCYRCHVQLSRTCVPNLSCDYFNQSCSAEGKITPKLFCPMRQNWQSTKMYVVHHNTLSDSFRIRILWFQSKQDSDRIRISFFKNRIGSDSKKTLSDHHWYEVHIPWQLPLCAQQPYERFLTVVSSIIKTTVVRRVSYCIRIRIRSQEKTLYTGVRKDVNKLGLITYTSYHMTTRETGCLI